MNKDENQNAHERHTSSSSSSAATLVTTNDNRINGRPSDICTRMSSSEKIQHIRGTFLLEDYELEQFHRAFCYIAKHEGRTSSASFHEPKKESGSTHNWEEAKEGTSLTISFTDFFEEFQVAQHSIHFLDCIFDLVGTKNLHAITYDEFLDGVLTFGMFKRDDMLRFIFFILDKEKRGRIPQSRLLRFLESIHGRKIRAFERAVLPGGEDDTSKDDSAVQLPLAEMRKASVDYVALKQLCFEYPTMLEPMLLFQTKLRRRIMSEVWWRRKEMHIEKHFHKLDQSRKNEQKRLIKERERKLRCDMGIWAYYFRRYRSGEREKEYPLPIVSSRETSAERTQIDGRDVANL